MKYELMVVLKPLLPEDIRTGIQKKIESLLEKAEGKVLSQDNWGKRHLAYPIKKHEEGYYIVYTLELGESHIVQFKQDLKSISDILRLLLSKKD